MKVSDLLRVINADFYAGVPDSQLKALCDELMRRYGADDPRHHIIAANEGNALALAAGYHLATGKTGVVYLQNSGIGNIINPLASLCHGKVYGIPVLLIVGWRGEPGIHDEPQHVFQGEVTLRLLEDMGVSCFVLSHDTTLEELENKLAEFRGMWAKGKQTAIVVCKGALTSGQTTQYRNANKLRREDILRHILAFSGADPVVSTTGKTSRELFELREAAGQRHSADFLTVGSMGHSSSIALGIALQMPKRRVWCIDGDGAALMHLGAMAVIGNTRPDNLIHIVINNAAHESVGGMPTGAHVLRLDKIAEDCGYPAVFHAETFHELYAALEEAVGKHRLCLIEAVSAIGSRPDLGRPTLSTAENKNSFMRALQPEV